MLQLDTRSSLIRSLNARFDWARALGLVSDSWVDYRTGTLEDYSDDGLAAYLEVVERASFWVNEGFGTNDQLLVALNYGSPGDRSSDYRLGFMSEPQS